MSHAGYLFVLQNDRNKFQKCSFNFHLEFSSRSGSLACCKPRIAIRNVRQTCVDVAFYVCEYVFLIYFFAAKVNSLIQQWEQQQAQKNAAKATPAKTTLPPKFATPPPQTKSNAPQTLDRAPLDAPSGPSGIHNTLASSDTNATSSAKSNTHDVSGFYSTPDTNVNSNNNNNNNNNSSTHSTATFYEVPDTASPSDNQDVSGFYSTPTESHPASFQDTLNNYNNDINTSSAVPNYNNFDGNIRSNNSSSVASNYNNLDSNNNSDNNTNVNISSAFSNYNNADIDNNSNSSSSSNTNNNDNSTIAVGLYEVPDFSNESTTVTKKKEDEPSPAIVARLYNNTQSRTHAYESMVDQSSDQATATNYDNSDYSSDDDEPQYSASASATPIRAELYYDIADGSSGYSSQQDASNSYGDTPSTIASYGDTPATSYSATNNSNSTSNTNDNDNNQIIVENKKENVTLVTDVVSLLLRSHIDGSKHWGELSRKLLARNWNKEFQQSLEMEDSKEKFEKLRNLEEDFVYAAETYGRIIIAGRCNVCSVVHAGM